LARQGREEGTMKFKAVMALAALALLRTSAANADFEPVDCRSTSFALSGEAFLVDCERSNDPLRVGTSTGAAVTDMMTITTNDRTIFLTMLSRRITATRIYMQHRSLGESFRAIFDEEGVKDWRSIGNKGGFDVAEFTRDISGHESHCITVQRFTNAAHTGYKRHVIGMGCAVGKVEDVYQILDKIDAPGS
jgi:hypothetical protein